MNLQINSNTLYRLLHNWLKCTIYSSWDLNIIIKIGVIKIELDMLSVCIFFTFILFTKLICKDDLQKKKKRMLNSAQCKLFLGHFSLLNVNTNF